MRVLSVLFISFLLSFTLASKMDVAISALKSSKVSKTRLGSFIVNFAQFSQAVSSDFNPLFDALDELLAFLESQRVQENSAFSSAEIAHNGLVQHYTEQKSSASNDVSKTTSTLATLYDVRSNLEKEITTQTGEINNGNQQISDLDKNNGDRIKAFEQDVADTEDALKALDEALVLLRGLQTSDGAFVELSSTALAEAKGRIVVAFEKLTRKERKHSAYKPLFSAVLEILNKQNFVNQDLLTRTINLLNELKDSFSSHLEKIKSDGEAAKVAYTSQRALAVERVRLAEEALATANTNLTNTKNSIDTEEAFKKQREADESKAIEDLAKENDDWARSITRHENKLKEIEDEVNTVNECVNALHAGGVRRT